MNEMDNNNNDDQFDEIDIVRNSESECKIEFVSSVISQNDIPPDFKKIGRSNVEKIFFEINDGNKIKREWIVFINNTFYCAYCVCFSPLNANRLVVGIEYMKNCRISDKLKWHAKESNHIAAKDAYLRIAARLEGGVITYNSEMRNALTCIVKIIIYITTHGQYLFTVGQ